MNKIEVGLNPLNPADGIEYKDGTLLIETAETEVKLHLGWKPIRKIVDDYLKDVDQVEGLEIVKFLLSRLTEDRQNEAFKSIWDEPSYEELENEITRLNLLKEEMYDEIGDLKNSLSNYRERYGVRQ